VHNDSLIVAGGSRFPVSPLKGGGKIWENAVYLLDEDAQEDDDAPPGVVDLSLA